MNNQEVISQLKSLRQNSECHAKGVYADVIWTADIEALDIAIKVVEKKLNNGWVPVNERVPENNNKCLVTVQYENFAGICTMVTTGTFNDKNIELYGEQPVISNRRVTAWQPLPQPYKEDADVENK